MIQSMTGYGTGQGQLKDASFSVEIRTVNNRYFKSRIKLPDHLLFLEEEIDRHLRKKIDRGMVNYVLKYKEVCENALFQINEGLIKSCLDKISKSASRCEVSSTVDIAKLLDLPGMISPAEPDAAEAGKIKKEVLKVTDKAVDNLIKMRSAEGKSLAKDLNNHCKSIQKSANKIRKLADKVPQEYYEKLQEKIHTLLENTNTEIKEDAVAREVAIFAEKMDISEELARLESHLAQFSDACEKGGQVGRRLDFLTQEMLREANTIASKSGDSEITHHVVDMKCFIDKIKEQVQNVE